MRHLSFALSFLLITVPFLHFASTASAEMLLAEITYTTPAPVSAPASFAFGVGNSFIPSPIFHNWIESVPSFPYMSTADAATLAAFDRLLTTFVHEDGVAIGLSNGSYEQPSPTVPYLSLDRAFLGAYSNVGVTAIRHAPPIGETNALQWYALDLPPGMEPVFKLGLVMPTDHPCSFAEA